MLVRILENPQNKFHGKPGEVIDAPEYLALELERHGYVEFVADPGAKEWDQRYNNIVNFQDEPFIPESDQPAEGPKSAEDSKSEEKQEPKPGPWKRKRAAKS